MIEVEFELALPEYFAERYFEEIELWIQNRPKVGPEHHILLKEAPFADPSPNEDLGPVLKRVTLRSSIIRGGSVPKILVEPATEHDKYMIVQHCEKMIRHGVRSRQYAKEAPRAFVPFMPRILH